MSNHRISDMGKATKAKATRSGRTCDHCGNLASFAAKIDGRWSRACQGHSAAMLLHAA